MLIIGFNVYLSKRRFKREVIILKLTYKSERKRPWDQEINDFEATYSGGNFHSLQRHINNYMRNFDMRNFD